MLRQDFMEMAIQQPHARHDPPETVLDQTTEWPFYTSETKFSNDQLCMCIVYFTVKKVLIFTSTLHNRDNNYNVIFLNESVDHLLFLNNKIGP